VDEGTALTDCDEEEIARKISLNITPAYVEHKGSKINLIDTPGYAAFIAHAKGALRVCETALFVVDGVSGIGIQTEKAWEYADELQRPRPRFIVINKLDKERADFGATLDALRERFGHSCVPLTLPIGAEKNFRGVVDVVRMKAYEFDNNGKPKEIPMPEDARGQVSETHEKLVEAVAESDETLMEHFFDSGSLNDDEFIGGIKKAILNRSLTPVFAMSSANMAGVVTLLDAIVDYAPNPADLGPVKAKAGADAGALRFPHRGRKLRQDNSDENLVGIDQIRRHALQHRQGRAGAPGAASPDAGQKHRKDLRGPRRRHRRHHETERHRDGRHTLRQGRPDLLRAGEIPRGRDSLRHRTEIARR
jgi:elongation factor G